jgi:hypothetical protein
MSCKTLIGIFYKPLLVAPLELLQGDNPNWLNFEEFMNKVGFYVVQLHQLAKI